MPGDTKIKQNASGQWIDVDNPTVTHSARRLARQARRNRLGTGLPSQVTSVPRVDTSVAKPKDGLTITPAPGAPGSLLTGLQARLLDRLTNQQGVDLTDALQVITSNGYNKAASYGHMRAAGASHNEAVIVIDLDMPDVSRCYGIARANGENHADAIKGALAGCDDGDDDDDDD